MNRRRIFVQLAIFGVLAVLVTYYTLFYVIGVSVINKPYHVTVQLTSAGGSYNGSDVTYRGVHVGRVTDLELRPAGVTLTIAIDSGKHIPVRAVAHVLNLSVVGEQYIDFVADGDGGPYLKPGAVVPASRTTTPVQTATLLFDLSQWINSIDPKKIGTVSRELGDAFAHSGPELRQIIASGADLVDEMNRSRDAGINLLKNSKILLDTAAAHAGDLIEFSRSLRALAATLRAQTPTITKFLKQAGPTTSLFDDIIRTNASSASVLLGNLATFSQIQVANIPGWRALLVAVPEFAELAPQVVHNGTLRGAALFDYSDPVCSYGVPMTSPISGTRTPLQQRTCAHPQPGELARGAANAPESSASANLASYNPGTGLVTDAAGESTQLGWTGGQQELVGPDAWKTLILSVASN